MKNKSTKVYQQYYLDDQIWILVFGGAFQRANVYKPGLKEKDERREEFRLFVKDIITTLFNSSYRKTAPSTNDHIKNLSSIKKKIDRRFKTILTNRELKFGVVQKLFNLYLKHKWCLGHCPEPPHCPFDRIILGKLGLKPLPNWTIIKDKKIYEKIVERTMEIAGGKSIAQWELENYSRR